MNKTKEITIDDMLKDQQEELGMRHGVYARLVGQGKMSGEKRDHKIRCTQEMINLLKRMKVQAGSQKDMFHDS